MRYVVVGMVAFGLASGALAQGQGRGPIAPPRSSQGLSGRLSERGPSHSNYQAMIERTQRERVQRLDATRPLMSDARFGDGVRERDRYESHRATTALEGTNRQWRQRDQFHTGAAEPNSTGTDTERARLQERTALEGQKLEARQIHFRERLAQIDRLRDQALESGNTALLGQADRMEQDLRQRQTFTEQHLLQKQESPTSPGTPATFGRQPARVMAQRGEETRTLSTGQRFRMLQWLRRQPVVPETPPQP